jgi:hypothetical protein
VVERKPVAAPYLTDPRFVDEQPIGHHPPMTARWTTLVIDAHDPESLASFWAAVLSWDQHQTDPTDGSVVVADPDRQLPILLFLPTQEAKSRKNRVHLDVNPVGCDQQQELARLVGLGAREVDIGQRNVAWVVLADPEGNEFCLLHRRLD